MSTFCGRIADEYGFCQTIFSGHLEDPKRTDDFERQQVNSKRAYLLGANQKAAFMQGMRKYQKRLMKQFR